MDGGISNYRPNGALNGFKVENVLGLHSKASVVEVHDYSVVQHYPL